MEGPETLPMTSLSPHTPKDNPDNDFSHTVLAGTISGCAPIHRILYYIDTVRHGFPPYAVGFLFRGSGADAKETVLLILLFGFHSYQYWTLNPGQEATEPKLSPPDPLSVMRTEDRRMTEYNDAV